jgi:hypothetical protein
MLSVIMLNAIMLSVIMTSVIMLSTIVLCLEVSYGGTIKVTFFSFIFYLEKKRNFFQTFQSWTEEA